MIVLGIETSCDETAVGIVVDGTNLIANVIENQTNIHSKYGGIILQFLKPPSQFQVLQENPNLIL